MTTAPAADGSLNQWLEGIKGELKAQRSTFSVLLRSLTKRSKIAVVTDSACALPEEIFSIPGTEHLRIIPLPVMVDGQIYTEGNSGHSAELPIALASGKKVQTSRPAPGRFREVYAELQAQGYQNILSVHMSGKLSGTADAARLAAQSIDIPVTVVDTSVAAMALGYMVLDALHLAALGHEAHTIAAILEAEKELHGAYFTVANLEALTKGGRISALSGLLGTILNVKPVLYLQDGSIQLVEKTRNYDRAVQKIQDLTQSACQGKPHRIALHYFGDKTAANKLLAPLNEISSLPVPLLPMPTVLAAHTGLGSVGITYSPHVARYPAK